MIQTIQKNREDQKEKTKGNQKNSMNWRNLTTEGTWQTERIQLKDSTKRI